MESSIAIGEIILLLGCVLLTKGRKADSSESEERYKTLVEHSLQGIVVLQRGDMKILYSNKSVSRILGYTSDELLELSGKEVFDLIHPKDQQQYTDLYGELSSRDPGLTPIEIKLRRKDSKYATFEVMASAIKYQGIDALQLSLIDISQRKAMEQQLRESEGRYRIFAENVNDVIWTTDIKMNFTYVSPSITSLLGYSVDEVLQMSFFDLMTAESAEKARADLVNDLEEFGTYDHHLAETLNIIDLELVRKDKSTVWTENNQGFLRDIDGSPIGVVGVTRDISAAKKAEEELKASYRDLELYASILHHDLANDVQLVMNLIESIELFRNDKERMDEYLSAALGASKRMGRVLAVFGKRRMDVEPRIISLIELIADQTKETYPALHINLDASEKTHSLLIHGGRLIPMVFDNMFRNVVDYAGEDASIWIKVRSSKGEVRVDITDSGPGIAKELQETLFQKGASTSGGGLGLHLSKRIVEAYGGSMELLRAKGKNEGATFRVTLPIT